MIPRMTTHQSVSSLELAPLVRLSSDATLRELAAVMVDSGVSAVLVGTEPLALVTEHDITDAVAAGMGPEAPASGLCKPYPVWVNPTTTTADALATMVAHHVRHLAVVGADGKPRGILDVLSAARSLGHPTLSGPIVVGLDGSANSERALSWSAALAAAADVPILAVHASGLVEEWSSGDRPGARLGDWCRSVPSGVAVRPLVREGPAPEILTGVADEVDAAMIVVGTRGVSRLPTGRLGSVTAALLELSHCPVVVVEPPAT